MGFRFQKRLKILPGITINLSKSGVSTSIGPRGAKITLGHGKIRKTVGIPGSGISYTTTQRTKLNQRQKSDSAKTSIGLGGVLFLIIFGFIVYAMMK
jgi:hypothetical protein